MFATTRLNRRAVVARVGSTMLTAKVTGRDRTGGPTDSVQFRSFRLSPLTSATRVSARERVFDEGVRAFEIPALNSPGKAGSEVLSTLCLKVARIQEFVRRGAEPSAT